MIYSSNGSRLNLQDAGFGHGRLTSSGVEYHLRDHLGSTRVVFDETSEALARNDYMPFGRKWDGGFIQSAANNRWLYNGKESQSSLGVNYLDYGSRMYCPQSGRWVTIDPLTEKYYGISPFAYCANKPVMYVDPDGRRIWPAFKALMDGMSGSLTIGLQVASQIPIGDVPVGFEVNLGSAEVIKLNGGDKTISSGGLTVGTGVSLGVGVKGEITWSIDPSTGNLTMEEEVKLSTPISTTSDVITTEYKENGEVAKTQSSTSKNEVSSKVANIIGIELTLDLNKALEALILLHLP